MSVKGWIKRNAHSLCGRCVAVSGSTGGLGQELCRHLALLGARLVLLDRNRKKALALGEALRQDYPELELQYITLDLEDFSSVKTATEALLQINVDFLILNAGAYAIPRKKCDTGFDNVFQINFLAPYYIARQLFHSIASRGGRVIIVSSIAHNYSVSDDGDVDFSTRDRASLVYGNAKRLLTYSLMSRYAQTGALAITHPGITFTNITAHYPKLIFAIIKYPMKVIFMRPKKAALSILSGIFYSTGESEWIGPRLFNVWGMPKKKRLTTAGADEVKRISDLAEEIYNKL